MVFDTLASYFQKKKIHYLKKDLVKNLTLKQNTRPTLVRTNVGMFRIEIGSSLGYKPSSKVSKSKVLNFVGITIGS